MTKKEGERFLSSSCFLLRDIKNPSPPPQELLKVAYTHRLPTEIIAIAHDQMNHYRMRHELYSKVNLKLPEKTYPVGFFPEKLTVLRDEKKLYRGRLVCLKN
jgi:hypothetical protein